MKLAKAIASVGGLTLISRITGFLRDKAAAQFIGTGMLMDAFVVAFRLPNLFRALFAEGAFHSVFVPLFAKKLESSGRGHARQLAGKILSYFAILLLAVVLVIEIFMPQVIELIAGGAGVDKSLAVHLGRILFPYMLIVALASGGAAMLNSLHQFVAAAMLPIILNIGMVIGVIYFRSAFATPVHAFSYAVIISGVIQLIWISYFCYKSGVFPQFFPMQFSPEVKLFFIRLIPGLTAAGVYQINVLLGTRLASAIEGANSWLYYADRIYQLPLGVIGIAASTALLPMISQKLEAGDELGAISVQNKALEITLILAFPCMVALITLGRQATAILFQNGAFMASDTIMVSQALMAYAFGLPAAMIIRTLSAGFFGRGDTKTPFYSAVFAVIAFAGFNILFLYLKWGHIGIALSTSFSVWAQALLLIILLKKAKYWQSSTHLRSSIVKSLLISIPLGLGLYKIKPLFLNETLSFGAHFLRVGLLFSVCVGLWFILAFYTGLLKRLRC